MLAIVAASLVMAGALGLFAGHESSGTDGRNDSPGKSESGLPPESSTDAEHREKADRNWPHWRGPRATGVAPHGDPPVKWSETKNVRWKVELPGKGHSTPVLWDDRLFLTASIPFGEPLRPRPSSAPGAHDNLPVTHHHRFIVMAVNRRDGKIAWQKTVRESLPQEAGHVTASLASNSPVTDGEHVFAFFGSFGLYCFDLDGELKWKKDLGVMQVKHGHGEGSSPVLHGDTLIVNWDHEGKSFITAFDKRTGEQRWKVDRDEETSWASPIVVEHDGTVQVVVSGTKRLRGYDLATGKVIWECKGLSSNIVASPVAGGGMAFAGSSYEKQAMLAVKLEGAKGDISGTDKVAWSRSRGTPYVPSPLLYGDTLYFHTHYQNVFSRVEAKTGESKPGAFRLNGIGNVYASAVGAAGRVYITDREGATLVLRHADEPEVLALNRLEDTFSASAAIAGNELFLRGERYLYCVAEP